MENLPRAIIIVTASALCFFTLLHDVHGESQFFVEGKVYCDTCRAQFITKISDYVKGIM